MDYLFSAKVKMKPHEKLSESYQSNTLMTRYILAEVVLIIIRLTDSS